MTNLNQWRVSADPEKHLKDLETSLGTIVKDLNLACPELQARAIRNKLVRRIDYHRSSIARNWRYGRFVQSGEHQSKRSDAWLCYVIRYTNNKRKLGQRRGSKPRRNPAAARKEAEQNAYRVKTRDQLLPVEQRAFDLLKGDRRKSDKHPIERQAVQLVKAVKELSNRENPGRRFEASTGAQHTGQGGPAGDRPAAKDSSRKNRGRSDRAGSKAAPKLHIRDPSRLVLRQQPGRRPPARLILEIDASF